MSPLSAVAKTSPAQVMDMARWCTVVAAGSPQRTITPGSSTSRAAVAPAASRSGVQLRLDPTFQPHFALYDGLVLKLVCRGEQAPLELASGGRYNALVGRFCSDPAQAAGVGFGFDVEALRELLGPALAPAAAAGPVLVAYAQAALLPRAMDALEALHRQQISAQLLGQPVASAAEAEAIAAERGCSRAEWLAA